MGPGDKSYKWKWGMSVWIYDKLTCQENKVCRHGHDVDLIIKQIEMSKNVCFEKQYPHWLKWLDMVFFWWEIISIIVLCHSTFFSGWITRNANIRLNCRLGDVCNGRRTTQQPTKRPGRQHTQVRPHIDIRSGCKLAGFALVGWTICLFNRNIVHNLHVFLIIWCRNLLND